MNVYSISQLYFLLILRNFSEEYYGKIIKHMLVALLQLQDDRLNVFCPNKRWWPPANFSGFASGGICLLVILQVDVICLPI